MQQTKIELAELSKLINRRKVADIRKHNMERIEHALKNGRSLKAMKTKLCIGKNQMYASRDKEGKVTTNMDRIVYVAEEFYRDLYSSRDSQENNVGSSNSQEESDIPPILTGEVQKALKGIQRGEAAGEDQVTSDLLKDGGEIILINWPPCIRWW